MAGENLCRINHHGNRCTCFDLVSGVFECKDEKCVMDFHTSESSKHTYPSAGKCEDMRCVMDWHTKGQIPGCHFFVKKCGAAAPRTPDTFCTLEAGHGIEHESRKGNSGAIAWSDPEPARKTCSHAQRESLLECSKCDAEEDAEPFFHRDSNGERHFVCPSCGGRHFGSELRPDHTLIRHCHDEWGIACRWNSAPAAAASSDEPSPKKTCLLEVGAIKDWCSKCQTTHVMIPRGFSLPCGHNATKVRWWCEICSGIHGDAIPEKCGFSEVVNGLYFKCSLNAGHADKHDPNTAPLTKEANAYVDISNPDYWTITFHNGRPIKAWPQHMHERALATLQEALDLRVKEVASISRLGVAALDEKNAELEKERKESERLRLQVQKFDDTNRQMRKTLKSAEWTIRYPKFRDSRYCFFCDAVWDIYLYPDAPARHRTGCKLDAALAGDTGPDEIEVAAENAKKEIASLHECLDEDKATIRHRERQLADKVTEIDSLNSSLEAAQRDIRYLREKVGSKDEEITQLIAKIVGHEKSTAHEVIAELEKARAAHGPMRGFHEGWAIIREEVDELWDEVKRRAPQVAMMRKEAIQVAAMGPPLCRGSLPRDDRLARDRPDHEGRRTAGIRERCDDHRRGRRRAANPRKMRDRAAMGLHAEDVRAVHPVQGPRRRLPPLDRTRRPGAMDTGNRKGRRAIPTGRRAEMSVRLRKLTAAGRTCPHDESSCDHKHYETFIAIPDTPATQAVLAQAKRGVSQMDKKCKCAPCFHLRAVLALFEEK